MNKINLEKIIRSHFNASYCDSIADLIDERATTDDFTDIIKEACRQVLERAAENIRWTSGQYKSDYFSQQQSILNTINEVE